MNRLFRFTIVILGCILLSSCSKEQQEPNKYEGKNYAYLSLQDGSQKNEVAAKSKELITLVLRLTNPLEEAMNFKLEVSEDLKKFFSFEQAEISIPKGGFQGSFSLTPKIPSNFYEEGVQLSIALVDLPKGIIFSDKRKVDLLLLPNIKKKLNEREEKLVQVYQEKFGVDLRPFLGEVECNGTIAWAGMSYDYPKIKAPEKIAIRKQIMIVQLSDKANEENIVLKFNKNALGLNPFFSKIWNNYTIYDEQFWNNPSPDAPPSNKAIREKINWTKETATKESFETYLDNVRLDPKTGKIDFLGRRGSAVKEYQKDYPYADERKERMKVVPFFFKLSVIERMIKAVKDDAAFAQIIETSDTNIYNILNSTRIDRDMLSEDGAFGETKYISPSASIDFKKGKMTFNFPQHIYNSEAYSIFQIECSIIE